MNKIIEFYSHNGVDNYGRTLKHMWSFNDHQLETTHDYIQWLFPTVQLSQYNPDAPLVDDEVIKAFRSNSELQSYLMTSSHLFERFLDLDNPNAHWLTHRNHNCLRITRVIDSLMTLHCSQRALQFLSRVEKAYLKSDICPVSFWNNAIKHVIKL
jgi:hypothetical protein